MSQRGGTAAGTERFRATLTRGPEGTITRKVEVVNGVSTQLDYVYDEDGRLTRVDRNGALLEQYAYDPTETARAARWGSFPRRRPTTSRTG